MKLARGCLGNSHSLKGRVSFTVSTDSLNTDRGIILTVLDLVVLEPWQIQFTGILVCSKAFGDSIKQGYLNAREGAEPVFVIINI